MSFASKPLILCTGLATALCATCANANDESLLPSAAKTKLEEREMVIGGDGPLDRPTGGLSFPSLQFSSENGEEIATATATFRLNRIAPVRLDDGSYRVSTSKITFTGETPLEEGGNASRIFSGDSLVTGSKLRVSFNRLSTQLGVGTVDTRGIEREATFACVLKNSDQWKNSQSDKAKAEAVGLFMERLKTQRGSAPEESIARLVRDAEAPDASLASDLRTECLNKSPLQVVEKYLPGFFKTFRTGFFPPQPSLFMGFDGTVGEDSYDVLDRESFEIDKVQRTSWEVGAHVGLIGDNLEWSIRGRAVIGRQFSSPENGTECRTVTGSTDPDCLEAPDGPPDGKTTGIISIEGRRLFNLTQISGDNKIGIAPQISYKIEDDDFNFEIPVYFSPDEKGNLTGGIKFAYSTAEDDFGVGLFVGVPFSTIFGS